MGTRTERPHPDGTGGEGLSSEGLSLRPQSSGAEGTSADGMGAEGLSLEGVATELYGLAPSAFVPARDERAKAARQAGDRSLAAAIKGLRRPSAGAWLANVLVRQRAEQVGGLLELGVRLRQAQAELSANEIRRLSAERRKAVQDLAREAVGVAEAVGQSVSDNALRDLESTLDAALADADAADALSTGRLVSSLSYTGLGAVDLEGAVGLQPVGPSAPDGGALTKGAPMEGAPGDGTARDEAARATRGGAAGDEAAGDEAAGDGTARDEAAVERAEARRPTVGLPADGPADIARAAGERRRLDGTRRQEEAAAALAQAHEREGRARRAMDRAQADLARAQQAWNEAAEELSAARQELSDAERGLSEATAALEALGGPAGP